MHKTHVISFIIYIFCCSHVTSQTTKKVEDNIYINQPIPSILITDDLYTHIGYISLKNGLLETNKENYLTTDFINSAGCNIIECVLPPSKIGGIAFYDSNKNFLSGFSIEKGNTINLVIPQNTSFIRLSKRTDLSGRTYGAKLYYAKKIDHQNHNLENNNTLQKLKSNLYALLNLNYIPVFTPNDFIYNSIDKNGYGVIDSCKKERFSPTFRLPIHIKTKHGTILIAANAIREQKWLEGASTVIARSTNNGKTFEKKYLCKGGNLSMVYDKINDKIFCIRGLTYSVSNDDGKTWSKFKEMNITKPSHWEKFYVSPNTGIQLTNGVLAIPYILLNGEKTSITKSANVVVYSSDYGKNWKITPITPDSIIANENTIVEYAPNQIMINARGGTEIHWNSNNPGRRIFIPIIPSNSELGQWYITGWKQHESDRKLLEPICNASLIACSFGKYRFGLFCNPYTKEALRKNLMLQVSSDFTHWSKVGLLTPYNHHLYGYCSLNYEAEKLSFVFEDTHAIIYADLTPYIDEILTKMIVNKMLFE